MGDPAPGPPDVHLNLNVRGMGHSPTVAINERSNRLLKEGRRVFKLGLGQSPFPVPQSVVEQLRANAWRKDYLEVQGLHALRSAVAEYHRRKHGVPASARDVLIGPGSKELMFLLQLVYYGELVVPTPAWVSYAPQAQIVGRNVRFIHTRPDQGWQLHPRQVDELCRPDPRRPRILILNYPSNPTGQTYEAGELQELAEVARRYGLVVLSDEIYGELHNLGHHVSIARYYPEGTIVASGLSKWCGAGGWRLGTFTFPHTMHWLLDAMAAVASETYTSTSAPIQFAAIKAFRGGTRIERYLWMARRLLAPLGAWIVDHLRTAGIEVLPPAGAFYAFPDFGPLAESLRARGIGDSVTLCERMLEETGVAVLPGSVFGRPADELTVRLAFVDFDGATALVSLENMPSDVEVDHEFLEIYCPNVLNAIRRMAAWAKGESFDPGDTVREQRESET